MRAIDRWAGVPVCFMLTLVRRCGTSLRRRRALGTVAIRKILFVKLAEQGATVLAYAAIRKAADRVGPGNVYFLVFEQNRFILDTLEVIPAENIITIPTRSFPAFVAGAVGALRRLRKLRIDAALDFEFFARASAAIAWLSGAAVRIGVHSFAGEGRYRGDLMTHRLVYNPHIHTSQMYQVMVDAMDSSPGRLPSLDMVLPAVQNRVPSFRPSPQDLQRVRSSVEQAAGGGDFSPLILLNANASDLLPLRRWPPGRYVELARRLLDSSPRVHIAFTGAPDEAAGAEEHARLTGSPRCFSLAGKTTLHDLLVLYCLADVIVTNDSGPALFAALTPIRVVVLFGPETPRLFGNQVPGTSILWGNLPCSPCVSAYNGRMSRCTDNLCMQRITVDTVFETIRRICRL